LIIFLPSNQYAAAIAGSEEIKNNPMIYKSYQLLSPVRFLHAMNISQDHNVISVTLEEVKKGS